MLIGTLVAIAHGSAFPLVSFILGQLCSLFVCRFCCRWAWQCHAQHFHGCPRGQYLDWHCESAVLHEAFGVSLEEVMQTWFSNSSKCLSNKVFLETINKLVYGFVGIVFSAFVAGFTQISFFQVACERQVKKIRLHYYRSVLRQNIGWFNANPSRELSSRLLE